MEQENPARDSAPASLMALIEAAATRGPDVPAIMAPGRPPLSYARLQAQMHHIVALLNGMGIRPNDRVAVVLPDGPELAVAFLAIASAAACAPLNPAYREAEVDFYLSDLNARALIVPMGSDSPAVTVARARGIPVVELEPVADGEAGLFTLHAPGGSVAAPPQFAGPDDVALVLHTSGTTSRPKMVPLTGRNLCASAHNVGAALALQPSDRCLNVMPLFHIHGLVAGVLSSMAAGAAVVCTHGFVAPEFFHWMEQCRPTWYTAVPTMHQAILARAKANSEVIARCPLRLIRSSSASLPPPVMAELEAVFGCPVIEAYGMTEAAHQIASNPLPPRARKPGSVGLAAGPAVGILGPDGKPLPANAVGEVALRGANVTRGYEANPEANAAAFTEGWFRTGDQGYLDAEGYLYLTGRLKELINRGGEKIAPREVDEALLSHPAVAQAVAFAVPDPRLGEEVAAAVVLHPGASATERELQEWTVERLAQFKVPRRILFRDEIPKGPTGKLQRIGLAERLGLTSVEPEPVAASDAVAAASPREEMLAALWAEVLGLEHVATNESFLRLGGDSILAARLLSRVEQATGVRLTLPVLFGAGATVARMAEELERAGAGTTGAAMGIPPAPPEEPLPLSFSQEHQWLLQQMSPESAAFAHAFGLRLRGPLERAALQAALDGLVARHEPLRTTLVGDAGEPRQVVLPELKVALSVSDLSALPEAQREGQALESARALAVQAWDLARGPLLRTALLRLGAEDHLLAVAVHQTAFDGWSEGIFVRELAALYEAALTGRTPDLPALPIRYGDFARWQRERMQEGVLARDLEWWKERLADAPTPFELPGERRGMPGGRGARQAIALPAALTEALRNLAREEEATLFMALLAGLQTVLHRYTGREDLVVGTPVLGRNQVETEGLIGLFINTLALRTDLSGDPSFRELLERARATALEAFAHGEVPYERLLRELTAGHGDGNRQLFQVLFVLKSGHTPTENAGGLDLEPVVVDNGTAKVDLELELWEGPEGLSGHLQYDTDRLDAAAAARLVGHLQTLLAGAVAHPEARISALPLLTEEERQQVLVRWNETRADYPRDACIHHLIEAQAARTPERIAFDGGAERLTYAELNRRANQLAHFLRGQGVGPDTRVGLCVERSPEMAVGLLGILKAGGAYVPLDPAYPRDRLAYMLGDSGAPLLLTQAHLMATLPDGQARVVALDADWATIAQESAANPEGGAGAESAAYVIYTSGSTGAPKGVVVTHRSVVNHNQAVIGRYGIGPADRVMQFASLSFDGAVEEIFPTWMVGATLVPRSDEALTSAGHFLREIERKEITVAHLPTAFWHEWVRGMDAEGARIPDCLRAVIVGGEKATASAYMAWRRIAGERVRWLNSYGPTEATVVATVYEPGAGEEVAEIPIGRPLANVRAYVLDAHGQPVPVGVAGELVLGGDCLARGYLDRPELTAERFLPDPFSPEAGARFYRTGDRVRYRADGNLEYLGRVDDQVKIRGFRVEPGEIEAALTQHPSVAQAVVVVREDVEGDRRLVAYVVPKGGAQVPAGELRHFLRARLPEYLVPSTFIALDALPFTPAGKVDRKALPAPDDRAGEGASGESEAPHTPTEKALAEIWSEVLRVSTVGRGDDFFALGGHSLLAMRTIGRVREAFGVDLPLRALFEGSTLAEMAAAIEALSGDGGAMAALLAELDGMSEEDAERVLRAMQDGEQIDTEEA